MYNIKNIYTKKYDPSCHHWQPNRVYNLMYLESEESYFNHLLKVRGYVLLRDIYECLGLAITKESLVVGWYYDPKNPFGDNYIDFGLPKTKRGASANVVLNFNVDGDITYRF